MKSREVSEEAAIARTDIPSPIASLWRNLTRSRLGIVGLIILLGFAVTALSAPQLAPYDPRAVSMRILEAPSREHILGTTEFGNDVFSQVLYGARISLYVGFVAAIVCVAIGTIVGLVAGFCGGLIDSLLMRVTDVFLVLPGLPLMIALAAILGPSLQNVILVITILGWPGTARLVRSQTLSTKELPYVEAARVIGCRDARIVGRHILPNILGLVFSNAVIIVVYAITSEAVLSFLGVGDISQISWGVMLHFAFTTGALSSGAYWYVLGPGLSLITALLAFMFVAFSLGEVVNPRLRQR